MDSVQTLSWHNGVLGDPSNVHWCLIVTFFADPNSTVNFSPGPTVEVDIGTSPAARGKHLFPLPAYFFLLGIVLVKLLTFNLILFPEVTVFWNLLSWGNGVDFNRFAQNNLPRVRCSTWPCCQEVQERWIASNSLKARAMILLQRVELKTWGTAEGLCELKVFGKFIPVDDSPDQSDLPILQTHPVVVDTYLKDSVTIVYLVNGTVCKGFFDWHAIHALNRMTATEPYWVVCTLTLK